MLFVSIDISCKINIRHRQTQTINFSSVFAKRVLPSQTLSRTVRVGRARWTRKPRSHTAWRRAIRHMQKIHRVLISAARFGATDVYKRCRKSTSRQQTSYKSVNQSKSIPRDRRAVCSRDRAINVAHSWPTPTSGLSLLSTAHAPRDGWKEKPDRLLHGACGDSDKAHKAQNAIMFAMFFFISILL